MDIDITNESPLSMLEKHGLPAKPGVRKNNQLDKPCNLSQKELSKAIDSFMFHDFKMFMSVWVFRNMPMRGMEFADNRVRMAYVQKLAYQCMKEYIKQQGLYTELGEHEQPDDNPMTQPPVFSAFDMRRIHDNPMLRWGKLPPGRTHTVVSDGYKWWYKRDDQDRIWLLKCERVEEKES